ncbi:MAG: hypothetical protein EOM25_12280, partial [Deltaproteobacteria bacterium]|nr:hypothetical protein [Deltaproteobacteria bacterium]
ALRLAHTLKSAAATLEARELAQAAAQVEAVLRKRQAGDLTALLAAMEAELAPALATVERLAGEVSAGGVPNPEVSGVSGQDLGRTLAELQNLVAANSLKARKVLAGMRSSLDNAGLGREAAALAEELDGLDFQNAVVRLEALAALVVRAGTDTQENG